LICPQAQGTEAAEVNIEWELLVRLGVVVKRKFETVSSRVCGPGRKVGAVNKVGKGVMGLSGTVLFWLKASKKVYWNLEIPTIVQHK